VVCPSRNFDATSGSLPAPMIEKLVTRRILSEQTTCKVVQGVEISEAARKGRIYSGWLWWAHEANRWGTASKVDYLNTESCSYNKSLTDSSDARPQKFINRLETTQGMVLTQMPSTSRTLVSALNVSTVGTVLYEFEKEDLQHRPDCNQASRIEEHYSFLIFNAERIAILDSEASHEPIMTLKGGPWFASSSNRNYTK